LSEHESRLPPRDVPDPGRGVPGHGSGNPSSEPPRPLAHHRALPPPRAQSRRAGPPACRALPGAGRGFWRG